MHQSDTQLTKKAQLGQKKAIRVLYDRYETRWFLLCLRYAGSRTEAQDIFQEGVTKVFHKISQFDAKKGAFYSWSCKVIINEALKFLKKYQRYAAQGDISDLENHVDYTVEITESISAKELVAIIQKLPMGYRMVFNLYEIEGYTHKEIAHLLNISVGTSKSQLFKAKQLLQRKMKQLF